MVAVLHRVGLAGLLAAGLVGSSLAGAAAPVPDSAPAASAVAAPHPAPRSRRGEMYYAVRYGVDQLQVRAVSSGASLEFRYRVLDSFKAAVLNDKRLDQLLREADGLGWTPPHGTAPPRNAIFAPNHPLMR